MLLVLILGVLFLNFVTYYLCNVEYICRDLSKSEKRKFFKSDKNLISKLLFIKSFKQSNIFYWGMNCFNNISVAFGIPVYIIHLFADIDVLYNYVGAFFSISLVANFLMSVLIRLLTHIIESKSVFAKIFLAVMLVVYLIGFFIISFNKIF